MNEKIQIILVDDHQLFREGLKKVLNESDYLQIIAEASNGIEFLNLLKTYSPDVVLMDISMPEMNGIEATKKAVIQNSEIKIIALSMYDDQEYYYKMIHAGVKGFVLKTSNKKELENAIQIVYNGDCFFSNELLRNIILNFTNTSNKQITNQSSVDFTKRETEILQLLCKGLTNQEIAKLLHVSTKTIDTHRLNLLSKTGTKTTVSLVMYAIKNKLFDLN